MSVLEGDLLLIETDEQDPTDIRSFLARNVWGKLNANVKDVLESIRLSDLAEEYLELQSGKEMYYI